MSTIIVLIVIAILLFSFEIIIPGGILGVIGVVFLLIAYGYAYATFAAPGLIITIICSLVASVVIIYIELKIFPETKLGKIFILKNSNKETSMKQQADDTIVGKTGVVLTTMSPSGLVEINGKQYESFSQSGLLEEGTEVEVASQDNFRLIVRKLS